MWVSPIFDRDYMDIENRTPKAFCNYNDLNRVEGNCEYLGKILSANTSTRMWNPKDFPTASEMERLIRNMNRLREKAPKGLPSIPTMPINTWEKWNVIEKILFELKEYCDDTMQNFAFTGESYTHDMGAL